MCPTTVLVNPVRTDFVRADLVPTHPYDDYYNIFQETIEIDFINSNALALHFFSSDTFLIMTTFFYNVIWCDVRWCNMMWCDMIWFNNDRAVERFSKSWRRVMYTVHTYAKVITYDFCFSFSFFLWSFPLPSIFLYFF